MPSNPLIPFLTIAGSDSGGSAGIQADVRTAGVLGFYGMTAVTALTAQNPDGVSDWAPTTPELLLGQIKAVDDFFQPRAVKTGMLPNKEIIDCVAGFYASRKVCRITLSGRRADDETVLVVDPVMVATSGDPLIEPDAVRAVGEALLPLCSLATPNLHEAGLLLDRKIETAEDKLQAARDFVERFGCPVMLKGGHPVSGEAEAVDLFFDGKEQLVLAGPLHSDVDAHGSGCTYSSALACHLVRSDFRTGLKSAREYMIRAFKNAVTHAPTGRKLLGPGR